jgi:DNA-binding transcriptional regulator YiaG
MKYEIKDLRTASGMTQQAFGDYFGIPKRTVQNWEGDINSCPEYLLKLIEYKLVKEGKMPCKKGSIKNDES